MARREHRRGRSRGSSRRNPGPRSQQLRHHLGDRRSADRRRPMAHPPPPSRTPPLVACGDPHRVRAGRADLGARGRAPSRGHQPAAGLAHAVDRRRCRRVARDRWGDGAWRSNMTAPSAATAGRQELMLRDLLRTDPVASLLLVRWRVPYLALAAICLALLILLLVVLPLRWPRVASGAALQRPEEFFDT